MIDKLVQIIKNHKIIAVFRHILPDPDALGAQYAIATWIRNNFPNKKVYIIGEIKDKNLLKQFKPELEPDISVLNNALGIAVDTPILNRIDFANHFSACMVTVIIDHHPTIKEFANYHFGGVSFSATCEYLGIEFINNENFFPELKINTKICEYLFCGLVSDTNRFFYNNVEAKTFYLAGQLAERGVDLQKIYKLLYSRSLNKARLAAHVTQNFQLTKHGVGYFYMTDAIRKKFHVPYLEAKDLIYAMQSIADVDYCAFVSFDEKNKVYRVSLRSSKRPVNGIAQSFNGGGHAFACGIKIKELKTFDNIVNEIDNLSSLDYEE